MNIGYAKLQMQDSLRFSNAVYGLGASIFFVGYLLFSLPSNLLMGRIGARRTILILVCGWGLASAGLMFVVTPLQFYIGRFLLGAFEAGVLPGIILYLSAWFPDRWRGRMLSIVFSAGSAAGIIGGPLSGAIMRWMDGNGGLHGWQWLFLIEGLPSLAIGLAAYVFLTNTPSEASWLTAAEKAAIESDLGASLAPQARHSAGFLSLVRNPLVWLLSLLIFLILCGGYVISFWMPTLIHNFGVKDVFVVGLYSSIPFIASALSMVVVGARSDKTGERRWHFALPAFFAAAGLVLASVAWPHPAIPVAMLTVANMGLGAALTIFWALTPSMLAKPVAAAGIAVINSIGVAAGMFSPAAFGVLATLTGHYEAGLYLMAGLVALAGVLMIALVSPRHRAPAAGMTLVPDADPP